METPVINTRFQLPPLDRACMYRAYLKQYFQKYESIWRDEYTWETLEPGKRKLFTHAIKSARKQDLKISSLSRSRNIILLDERTKFVEEGIDEDMKSYNYSKRPFSSWSEYMFDMIAGRANSLVSMWGIRKKRAAERQEVIWAIRDAQENNSAPVTEEKEEEEPVEVIQPRDPPPPLVNPVVAIYNLVRDAEERSYNKLRDEFQRKYEILLGTMTISEQRLDALEKLNEISTVEDVIKSLPTKEDLVYLEKEMIARLQKLESENKDLREEVVTLKRKREEVCPLAKDKGKIPWTLRRKVARKQ